jgi:hypothetical protein
MRSNKNTLLCALVILLVILCLNSCTDRFPSKYILELPELNETLISILGEPHWRIEWINPNGQKQSADIQPTRTGNRQPVIEVEIPVLWTNPVTASPYWPIHNLFPNIFKPAGGFFPYDVSKNGNRLHLTWKNGADAIFYWELALAYDQNDSRIPTRFDWLRFRDLFITEVLAQSVINDPWVVNWRSVAEQTVESGFDRRRIVPEPIELTQIPVHGGTWYGTSPFEKPLFFAEGVPTIFPVRNGINIWVSSEGILKVNGNSWFFTKLPDTINQE